MDYFASKSRKTLTAGAPPSDPRLDSITRECAITHSHWTFLVNADAWQFWGKMKLIFYVF